MGILEQQQVADQRWRAEVDRTLEEHMERLGLLETRGEESEKRMTSIELKLDENTKLTAQINTNTGALVTWVANITGFKNTVKWLGGLVLWLSITAAALGMLWWIVKTGELPHKVDRGAPVLAGVVWWRRARGLTAGSAEPVVPVDLRDAVLTSYGIWRMSAGNPRWHLFRNGEPVSAARLRYFDDGSMRLVH
jgi:hypothetical protein